MKLPRNRYLLLLPGSVLLGLTLTSFLFDSTPRRTQGDPAAPGSPPTERADLARVMHTPAASPPSRPQALGAFLIGDQIQAPDGPATQTLARLTSLAESGDSVAALQAYMLLSRCDQALRATDVAARPSSQLTAESVVRLSRIQDAAQADCMPVASELRNRGKWLQQAADSGGLQAQLLYGLDAEAILGEREAMLRNPESVARYKNKAIGYLKSLSSRGSVDAMAQLAGAYEAGVLTQRSDMLAYAYWQAAALSVPDPAYVELAEPSRSRLSPGERTEALSIARKIHRSCCSGKQMGGSK